MDRRRPRWTGLIVGLLLCLPFGVMAHKAPHQTTRSFPVTNGRLLHALAEQLDMSHEDLLAALDPLRNLERLAEENGLTMDELRTTVRSTLQEQRKTSGTSLRERHPGGRTQNTTCSGP